MNPAVASYIVLLVSALVFTGVSMQKFSYCLRCMYQRNHKPAMLSMFLCAAWSVVAANGIWVKWYNPVARLSVDTPVLVMLIVATLFGLVYALTTNYQRRGMV